MTEAEALAAIDAIVRHSLELQRYSAHEEAAAVAELKALADELRQLLNSRTLSETGRRELNALLKEADDLIAARFANVAGIVNTEALTAHVAERTIAILAQVAPSASTIRAANLLPDARLFGLPLKDHWNKLAGDTTRAVIATVNQGAANGWTNDQITRQILGTRDDPGLLGETRRKEGKVKRDVRTMVHSSIMNAANKARMEAYRKAFGDTAQGVEWLATLDSRTCPICGALDGIVWDFDGKQIKGGRKYPFRAPPEHHNCRCTLTPFMEWLTIKGERASVNGPVKDMTFNEWIKRQPDEWVREEFGDSWGKGITERFIAGKVTLNELITSTGKPKTLEQIGG